VFSRKICRSATFDFCNTIPPTADTLLHRSERRFGPFATFYTAAKAHIDFASRPRNRWAWSEATSAPFSSALRLVSISASPPIATARPTFVQKIGRKRFGLQLHSDRHMLTPALHRLADYLQTDICRKQVRCNGKTVWSGSDDDGFDHRHQSGLSCLNGP
jgi:hypothetical protein